MPPASCSSPRCRVGEIQCIGATTPREHRKYIEKDRALERRFQPVNGRRAVDEKQTISILRGFRSATRSAPRRGVHDEAIVAAARLSEQRYITDRFLPDKAIDLVDEAGAQLRLADRLGPRRRSTRSRGVRHPARGRAAGPEAGEGRRVETGGAWSRPRSELADLNERLAAMKQRWENERAAIALHPRDQGEDRAAPARRASARSEKEFRTCRGPQSCATARSPTLEAELENENAAPSTKLQAGRRDARRGGRRGTHRRESSPSGPGSP